MSMNPEVLALTPPAVKAAPILPETGAMTLANVPADGELGPREALRMRVRWVQELSARTAWELGLRLADAGRLPSPDQVAHFSFCELSVLVEGGSAPADIDDRIAPATAPL